MRTNLIPNQLQLSCIRNIPGSFVSRDDIDFLDLLLAKPSTYQGVLEELEIDERQSVNNDTYGYVSEQDGLINITEG